MPRKRLLLVGGGHAHLGILKALREVTSRGIEVTMLSPEEEELYSGMVPGRVGGSYQREELTLPIRRLVEAGGGTFRKGWAQRVDPRERVVYDHRGAPYPYDVVSFGVGSRVPFEDLVSEADRQAIGQTIFPAKPVACLGGARILLTAIQAPRSVIVVGGGPGGREIAANIAWDLRRRGVAASVTLLAASRLVPRRSTAFRRRVLARLLDLGVEIREGEKVESVRAGGVVVAGRYLESEMTILAIGVVPPPLFSNSRLPTGPHGGLLVTQELQSVSHPEIFGAGDCIHIPGTPLDRAGVHALRAAPVLRENVVAALQRWPLRPFVTKNEYLLICNLADRYGVATKWGLTAAGRSVGRLKEAIDRRFVKAHQSA
ncbi:MAG: FAD-dependent oxidoreductase [Spirochaetaceae bacterium]